MNAFQALQLLTTVTMRPMDKSDLEFFAGVEGAGYIGEVGTRMIMLDDQGADGLYIEVYENKTDAEPRIIFQGVLKNEA